MPRIKSLPYKHILLFTWLIVTTMLFIFVSQVSHIQIFKFPSWLPYPMHLERIAPLTYIVDLMAGLAGITLFSVASLSLGLYFLQSLKVTSHSPLALGTTGFVVGEIFFSSIFLSIISLYELSPTLSALILASGFLLGFSSLRSFLKTLQRPHMPDEFGKSEKLIAGLIAFVFLAGLFYSSARLGYDATAEYFSDAKIMALSNHAIFFYPKDSFVVSSFHPGILFTVLIQLFGDQTARMLQWINGVAILNLGLVLAKNAGFSPRARLWFLTLMATTTAFVDLLGDGKVELITTAPILAATYWMFNDEEKPTKFIFALIGLMAGFAIISRPYNIFLVSIFVTLFYASQALLEYRKKNFENRLFDTNIFWALVPLLILGIFHLIQNWIWLKDPLAPLTYGLKLKSSDWQWQFDPTDLANYRLFYPLTVSFFNSPQSLGNISPLFVGFLPFLFFRNMRQNNLFTSRLQQMLLLIITTLILWIALFFTVVEIRYVLFLWIWLFIFMGMVIEKAIQLMPKPIQGLSFLLVSLLLVYINARIIFISLDTYSPIDKQKQGYCYDIGLCTFLEELNQVASPGDRVLVLNSYRYYLRPDLFACSSQSTEYSTLETLARQNSPNFWVEVYKQGYRYITYENNYAIIHSRFGALPAPELAPNWLHIQIISSTSKNTEQVYQISATNADINIEKGCVKNTDGIWEVQNFTLLKQ